MEFATISKILMLISLCSISNAADQRQRVLEFHADCLEVHDVDEKILVEALEGKLDHDEDFYKHVFCVCKKAKIIDDNGVVNTDNFEIDMAHVIDASNMDNVASIVRKCLVQKDDIMTTITEASDCFLREKHNL
ncbi:unnamed protein product [Ceutorhynchus assimilis]|uniref:Uncharacterized protein n=1 Tax=Ceutorhynchus assimilis TaxID=467358 RepID=A0A9N9MK12_9CUCU|nr:unnamed protein product [Ceutorhynchus assimilis]